MNTRPGGTGGSGGGMGGGETKNLILAAVLSMLVVFGWYAIFPPAPPPEEPTATQDQAAGGDAPLPTGQQGATDAPVAELTRDAALAKGDRLPIDSPAVKGSIRLEGARIDDLQLLRYNVRLNDPSRKVTLFSPELTADAYYTDYFWVPTAENAGVALPGPDTVWTVAQGEALTPQTPVTLTWDNGAGLIFQRTLALDENYMITVTQAVQNTGDSPVSLAPVGRVVRAGRNAPRGIWISHEGAIAQTDEERQYIDYSDLEEIAAIPGRAVQRMDLPVQQNGWLGFADRYWMASLIGKPGEGFDGYYTAYARPGDFEFRALMRHPVQTATPGATISTESYLFAGAKGYRFLSGYEDSLGIKDFTNAIDWGYFYFLTEPIFMLLDFINSLIGNMGFSIIMLTLIIKAVLLPLAYKSYVSMSKMKNLQPEMMKIKERCGDDRQKMQQEMMALYKKEKVNPASGCLPILLQIPIFFSLYKVLFVTIEMRHAPFIGWIEDLSAPDPTSYMNLFGLMPWDGPDPTSIFIFFSIGVYPILMGVTMWLQQKLNPAPTDPTQAAIFAWMPWVFMFMLGQFAAGLVIYWVANNTITFIQQYLIMRSQGVDVDILGNITKSFKKKKTEEASGK